MIFVTDARPDLPIRLTRQARTINFADGRYETTDPDEVYVLKRHPLVSAFTDGENTQVDPIAAAEGVRRDALDETARQAGVEHPERLPNKAAVARAIEAAQAPREEDTGSLAGEGTDGHQPSAD